MSILPGAWRYGQFVQSSAAANANAETAAQTLSMVAGIMATIVALNSDWSVVQAAANYTVSPHNNNAFGIIGHTSGARIVVCWAPGVSSYGIAAGNTEDGAILQGLAFAYMPTGHATVVGNPSSGSFFSSSQAFRFTQLVTVGTTPSYTVRIAVQNANVWIAMQFIGAAPSGTWYGPVLMGPDIIEEFVEPGDVYGHGQFRLSTTNGVLSLTSATAQFWNAAGNARRTLYTVSGNTAFTSANMQQVGKWFQADYWGYRDNADVVTTGIVAGRGIKGRIARYAAMMGGTAIPNKGRTGTGGGQHIHLASGVMLGWDDTYGPMP